MDTCRECGAELPVSAAFCEQCGAKAVKQCLRCGSDEAVDARFCGVCGSAFSLPAGQRLSQPAPIGPTQGAIGPTQGAPTPARTRSIVWVVAVLVVLAAIVASLVVYTSRGREATVAGADAAGGGQLAAAGGDGWSVQWSATDFSLNDVSFADSSHGWAVGGNLDGTVGIILATTDGGVHWEVQNAYAGFQTLRAVCAIDDRTCCAVGGDWVSNDSPGVLLMTRDGGATWTQRGSEHALQDVAFVDGSHGWCVGIDMTPSGECSGLILATADGGETWTTHLHEASGFMMGASFVDAETGWVITDTPHGEPDPSTVRIFKTSDAGATLEKQFEMNGTFTAISFVDDQHGWVAGADIPGVGPVRAVGVWATSDGGETWALFECPQAEYLNAVCFSDTLHGWAVGDGVYRTGDGGQTWVRQMLGGGPDLRGLVFVDASVGVIVGAEGTVLSTSDGGVGDGTPQSWDEATGASATPSKDEMRAYLRRLQQLIRQAGRGREKLREAVYGYDGGRLSGHDAAALMKVVIHNRSSVLDQVRGIAVPDGRARASRAALVAAMTASIRADERYLAWMEGRGGRGAATPYDLRAGAAKKRFVREYNRLAAQYGLRSDWKVEDL